MFSPSRIKLLAAVIVAAASLALVVGSYSSGGVSAESRASGRTLKSKILRRKDQSKLKPSKEEVAWLRTQASPQEERKFEDEIPKHVPIKVKLKETRERQFKDLGNPGWYRDFELEVTNTSDKPIYYLDLWLVYPEITTGSGAPLMMPLRYGRMSFRINTTLALPTDVPIKPKETYVFTIHDMDRRGWEWNKKIKNRPDPTKVELMFVELSFGDGTGFDGTDGKQYP
jgi:hypothetical protein